MSEQKEKEKEKTAHEKHLELEKIDEERYQNRIVVNLDDYEEVICPCGHCCCDICKCAENPDPFRGMRVCPCKTCKDSTKTHGPDDHLNPRKHYPKNQHLASEEVKAHRDMYPPKYV